MKTFEIRLWVVVCVHLCHVTRGYEENVTRGYEEDDWVRLEQWYVELHPKLWDIEWKQADKLTAKQHRQICDDVLRAIIPSPHNFSDCVYEPPEPNRIQSQRVLKFAPLKLEIRLVHVTIVKCIYKEIDFFLTHANDSHVFETWLIKYDKDFEEYLAYETKDERKLQEMFKKLHPHEKDIVWKDLGNLNPRTHKQLCDDVLKDIIPPDRDYNGFSYWITLHEYLHEEKVTMSAPLVLQNETVHITAVQCEYEEITFYITRADDNHMFTLVREPETEIFHLKAGLHPVQSNYTRAMTFTMPVVTTPNMTAFQSNYTRAMTFTMPVVTTPNMTGDI